MSEQLACGVCGSKEWDNEPKWRAPTESEHGWLRVPVFVPDTSRCLGCGVVIDWNELRRG